MKDKIDKIIDKIQSKCLRITEYCYKSRKGEKERRLCFEYNIDSVQS